MRAICWHCGEAVTYPPFAKSKEVLCPDCGEAVFMPLERVKMLLDTLVAGMMTGGMVWLQRVRLGDSGSWGGFFLLVAIPLGQYLLWPLIRKGACAVWTRHYDATGAAWGRYELPCWNCGRTVTGYAGQSGKAACPFCKEELFAPVKEKHGALLAMDLLLMAAVLAGLFFFGREWSNVWLFAGFSSVGILLFLLDILHDILLRRAYLRYLERYRSGEARPPKSKT